MFVMFVSQLVFSFWAPTVLVNQLGFNNVFVVQQVEQVRDMERELDYMKEEANNIQQIRNSLPDFCPNSNELCLEDQC